MSNDETKNVSKEVVGEIAGKVYEDVAHPALKAIGSTIAIPFQVIDALLTPVKEWVAGKQYNYDRTIRLLQEKLQDQKPEEIVAPQMYIAVPVMQRISWCYDSEELRDMYANLLASSMIHKTSQEVHPAFAGIIEQLSPDEAKIMREFHERRIVPVIHVRQYFNEREFYVDIAKDYTNLWEVCDNPNSLFMYMSNLQRLGLISVDYTAEYKNEDAYIPLEKKYFKEVNTEYIRGVAELTDWGRYFTHVCVDSLTRRKSVFSSLSIATLKHPKVDFLKEK